MSCRPHSDVYRRSQTAACGCRPGTLQVDRPTETCIRPSVEAVVEHHRIAVVERNARRAYQRCRYPAGCVEHASLGGVDAYVVERCITDICGRNLQGIPALTGAAADALAVRRIGVPRGNRYVLYRVDVEQ